MSQSLDPTVRTPAPAHDSEILENFDTLDPGGALLLVRSLYPKPVLRELQSERPGAFDWNVLEMGPEQFRIEVRRRWTPGSRTVTECLETDHRRLDAILHGVTVLVEASDFGSAGARFKEFSCGLDRHIEIEEQLLFPAFERLTGMSSGPTVVMRREHVGIRELLAAIARALDARDGRASTLAIYALSELVSEHNVKEERVLYPMTDRAAGDERGQHELVEQLQAL